MRTQGNAITRFVLKRPGLVLLSSESILANRPAEMSHSLHVHSMENVTLTPKEQTRLQVLNSLPAEHMTLDQPATLMRVSPRHTRRILADYRRNGIASLALYTDRHPVFNPRSDHPTAVTPTRFDRAMRAMEDLATQLIFALPTQAKGQAERTAGTLQDRLITELRLAGATTLEQTKAVLKQFLPRFNRRFGVPAQCPEPAFRPLQRVLCFKHRRRVTRDNTVVNGESPAFGSWGIILAALPLGERRIRSPLGFYIKVGICRHKLVTLHRSSLCLRSARATFL